MRRLLTAAAPTLAAVQSQDPLRPLTADALPQLIKHGVACYLFINPLFDASQSALRVVLEIIDGCESALSLFPPCHHHQTHLAMWRCSPLFTWEEEEEEEVLPEKTFSFNMNHSY